MAAKRGPSSGVPLDLQGDLASAVATGERIQSFSNAYPDFKLFRLFLGTLQQWKCAHGHHCPAFCRSRQNSLHTLHKRYLAVRQAIPSHTSSSIHLSWLWHIHEGGRPTGFPHTVYSTYINAIPLHTWLSSLRL